MPLITMIKINNAQNITVDFLISDVTDSKKFDAVVKEVEDVVGEDGLNVLYNNAGLQGFLNLDNVTEEVMMQIYRVNTIAPLMVSKVILQCIKLNLITLNVFILISI